MFKLKLALISFSYVKALFVYLPATLDIMMTIALSFITAFHRILLGCFG